MRLDDDDFNSVRPARTFSNSRALRSMRAGRPCSNPKSIPTALPRRAAAQRLAMQWAVRVNEALPAPAGPARERAAYLCELRGSPIGAESNTRMPAAFLMEQMEWREALDDASDAAALEAVLDRTLAA